MTKPAVEAVYDAVGVRVAALVPHVRPSVRFVRADDGLDVEDLGSRAERAFELRLRGLVDLSAAGRGVISPGVTDRELSVDVRVLYPAPAEQDLERQAASDAEVLARAFGRGGAWADPIRQSRLVGAAREDWENALVLVCTVAVQYRDVES